MDYKVYEKLIPKDFKSDGCTLAPDGSWKKCCIIHDHARRSSTVQASSADRMLYDCMKDECGIPALPLIYYIWVRFQSMTRISPIGLLMLVIFSLTIGSMVCFS